MPSAGSLDTFTGLAAESLQLYQHALATLDTECQRLGTSLSALEPAGCAEILEELEARQPELVQMLIGQTMILYYQDDVVVSALGLEPRPPHPGGYDIGETDWSLLDPVRERPKFWRE